MEKINLEIVDFEPKISKDKKTDYFRFKTNQGWMSCFDKKTIEELKKYDGKIVSVDITKPKDPKKSPVIEKLHGEAEGDVSVANEDVDEEQTTPRAKVAGTQYEKDPVGLTIDVFCAIAPLQAGDLEPKQAMKECIDLVKQVQKGFK